MAAAAAQVENGKILFVKNDTIVANKKSSDSSALSELFYIFAKNNKNAKIKNKANRIAIVSTF
jgi:hypothetical protein